MHFRHPNQTNKTNKPKGVDQNMPKTLRKTNKNNKTKPSNTKGGRSKHAKTCQTKGPMVARLCFVVFWIFSMFVVPRGGPHGNVHQRG